MEDLSTIANALKDAASPTGQDGSFAELVEKYLQSSDIAVRRAVSDTLQEVLGVVDGDQKQSLLEDSALSFVSKLIPLVADGLPSAQLVLNEVIDNGRPKEVILALSETLSAIEEQLLQDGVSEDGSFEPNFEEEASAQQLQIAMQSYTRVIPRLDLNRSTPTLLSLSGSLSSVLALVAPELDIVTSRSLLAGLCELLSALTAWVDTTSDKGGEQRAMLVQTLYLTITLLSPRIEARLAERWFISNFPQYQGLHKDDGEWKGGQEALDAAQNAAEGLGLKSADLVDLLTHPSSTSPYGSLAALTLLTSSQLSKESPSATPARLENCMPVLSAALSSSAIDAGLALTWSLVHRGAEVEFDSATLLLELLTPLAATPPSPTARLLVFKLIGAVVNAVQSSNDVILLFKQLLEPSNPFEQIRTQSLSLLREAISSVRPSILTDTISSLFPLCIPAQQELTKQDNSKILTPALIAQLGSILYTLPTSSSPPALMLPPHLAHLAPRSDAPSPLELPITQLVDTMYPTWFTECANVLRLLIQKDVTDASGVRNSAILNSILSDWIEPQLRRLDVLGKEAGDEVQIVFVLDRWTDCLERLEKTIKTVA